MHKGLGHPQKRCWRYECWVKLDKYAYIHLHVVDLPECIGDRIHSYSFSFAFYLIRPLSNRHMYVLL